jgi:hypothetical protein
MNTPAGSLLHLEGNFASSPTLDLKPEAPQLPNGRALAWVANETLRGWAFLWVVSGSAPPRGPAKLDLEYKIDLEGPGKNELVLRCPLALAEVLADAVSSPPVRLNPKAVFADFAYMYSMRLTQRIFPGRPLPSFQRLARVSSPLDWPDAPPSSSSRVYVEKLPLEIRLWLQQE